MNLVCIGTLNKSLDNARGLIYVIARSKHFPGQVDTAHPRWLATKKVYDSRKRFPRIDELIEIANQEPFAKGAQSPKMLVVDLALCMLAVVVMQFNDSLMDEWL